MTGARTNTLAVLRGSIERLEAHGEAYRPDRVTLGHADADATLQGGLAVGAMHEVFAEGRQSATATGFIGRLTTMGVAVLRTTTHRNGSDFEGLISICGRKAGT